MDYTKDYYSILGVDEKATKEALRASYRRLAKLHHPDKNPGNAAAEERFKIINEAYEVLSNEVSRQIYDSYRHERKKEAQQQQTVRTASEARNRQPFKQTKKRAHTVIREKKIYVCGNIHVKFQGTPDIVETELQHQEKRFTIIPTEVLVTILSPDIYRNKPPWEFLQGYAAAAIFTAPLKQPVTCKIITDEGDEYYQLDLYDIRIKDPRLDGITRHEQYSFGTLNGKLYGYLLHRYEETITETYTECFGATGNIETKTEAGFVFTREERYAANCSTYWTEWVRRGAAEHYRTYSNKAAPAFNTVTSDSTEWLWLIFLLIAVIIWPPLLYVLLTLAGIVLIAFIIGKMITTPNRVLSWLNILITGVLFYAVIVVMPGKQAGIVHTATRKYDTISSKKTIIALPGKEADTLITHRLRWQDKDSSLYTLQLSVPLSGIRRSAIAHNQMDEQKYALQHISSVYRSMLATGSNYMNPVVAAFDSLAEAGNLSRQQKASMIVSCVQSIPYTLILDKTCTEKYTDSYVNQYLTQCKNGCCKGNVKFGVQSPVEFLADLKGDCDTRALFLYDVLGKMGYKVALMTSNYYRHALIAVQLDRPLPESAFAVRIDGKPYYLWETTSNAFGPGELPTSISDLNRWSITLIQ